MKKIYNMFINFIAPYEGDENEYEDVSMKDVLKTVAYSTVAFATIWVLAAIW